MLDDRGAAAVVAQRVDGADGGGDDVEPVGDAGFAGECPLGARADPGRRFRRRPGRRSAELAGPQEVRGPLVRLVTGQRHDVVTAEVEATGRLEAGQGRVDHDVEPSGAAADGIARGHALDVAAQEPARARTGDALAADQTAAHVRVEGLAFHAQAARRFGRGEPARGR